MNLSNLIYLDTSFMIEVYEVSTNKPVPVKVTRSDSFSGGLSAGFISGGASTTETKEFPFSSRQMYEELRDVLLSIPTVDLLQHSPDQLPDYFWTRGIWGACGSQTARGDELLDNSSHFRLYSDLIKHTKSLILVTNDVYLSSGYDQIHKNIQGSCQGFGIEVTGLFKLLAIDPVDAAICAPLVMEKMRNV